MEYQVNQIVKGIKCGTFVILGFRTDLADETYAQLKEVNPNNHAEFGRGELALPLTEIKPLHS